MNLCSTTPRASHLEDEAPSDPNAGHLAFFLCFSLRLRVSALKLPLLPRFSRVSIHHQTRHIHRFEIRSRHLL
jgi:hypothetical protein